MALIWSFSYTILCQKIICSFGNFYLFIFRLSISQTKESFRLELILESNLDRRLESHLKWRRLERKSNLQFKWVFKRKLLILKRSRNLKYFLKRSRNLKCFLKRSCNLKCSLKFEDELQSNLRLLLQTHLEERKICLERCFYLRLANDRKLSLTRERTFKLENELESDLESNLELVLKLYWFSLKTKIDLGIKGSLEFNLEFILEFNLESNLDIRNTDRRSTQVCSYHRPSPIWMNKWHLTKKKISKIFHFLS